MHKCINNFISNYQKQIVFNIMLTNNTIIQNKQSIIRFNLL